MMTVAVAAMMLTAGAMNAQVKDDTTSTKSQMSHKHMQQKYKNVETSEIPAAVTNAVEKDYQGSSIMKAYVNDSDEYMLMLETEGTSDVQTVYANKNGEWIKGKADAMKKKYRKHRNNTMKHDEMKTDENNPMDEEN